MRAWLLGGPARTHVATRCRSFTMQQVLCSVENMQPSTGADATAGCPPAKVPRVATAAAAAQPLRVRLLTADASAPRRGSAGAAGYDLASAEDAVVPARGKLAVRTGLSIAVPHGTYGRVAPRSGLAARHFVDVGAGVIDEDYRGELLVLLFNHGEADFVVKKGDRVAQLVLERIMTPEVEIVESLDDTVRGAGGFGSTGVAGAPPS